MSSDVVKIVEVGPRDGLQNEKKTLSVDERVELIRRLQKSGCRSIEGGSFVSPTAIPQMIDSEKVWEALKAEATLDLSFLVPNQKGLDRALQVGVKSIAIFTATSDSFTNKNIGMSVKESLKVCDSIVPAAMKAGIKVRGYISTAFGCPYEGAQTPSKLYPIVKNLFELGCYEISIGDTIGVAHSKQVEEVFRELKSQFGLEKIAGHFHDTRGAALLNIKTAVDLGLRVFDSSIGGLGGCPYAQGSSGNVATEEVVWWLHGVGLKTGIELTDLLSTAAWVEQKISRPLKSKLFLSNPKTLYYF